ncbi:MAG: conserved rane protein of unknown function [Frankiales bacterium]|nr:conserved rane protein of unknown function [Frankiales bacterium]
MRSAVDVLAHGVGTRADLPIPVSLAIIGGGAAVLVSFLALGALWPDARLRGGLAGRPLPAVVQSVVDSRATTVLLRLIALVLWLVVLGAAFFGPADIPANVAPWAFYIQFWVGLVVASLLLGPVWRRVNPLRSIHWALTRLSGEAPGAEGLPRLGYWPAVVALLTFTFLELAFPGRSRPAVVGMYLLVYSILQLGAALWYGSGWFARGDGFEVYSSLIGRLSPFGRRDDGVLVVRNPLDGAAGLAEERGLAAVVVVLVGSTAFDGLTRTTWWQNGPGVAGDAATRPQLIGLPLMILLVAALYFAATTVAGRSSGIVDGPAKYAHSVIPIAAGYAIAHYFSLLMLDGQLTYILGSDPFGRGWDLFGTAKNAVDYTAVSPRTISLVQVAAIVGGHILGVVLAHDRAVRLAGPGHRAQARVSQYPLLAVMVVFTLGGLFLLLGG